jgi:hypothetical protein
MTAAASSSLLFGKACTVQVADFKITTGQGQGLDVAFKVHRGVKVTAASTKPQPNTCELSIFGLNPSHRKELEASTVPGAGRRVVPVTISAGYQGRQSVIFSGELRAAHSKPNGEGDIVTELETGDGDDALTQTRLTIALGHGSTATQGIRALLAGLGVGKGNIDSGIARLSQQALAAQLFSKGVVLKGAAADLMTDFCRSVGLDWSIQNGNLQLTAQGQPLGGTAILIDSDHGMINAPTVDTKGILSVETEMIPDVFPGVALSMNAATIKGGFRVIGVETSGETDGDDWGHKIEAARY